MSGLIHCNGFESQPPPAEVGFHLCMYIVWFSQILNLATMLWVDHYNLLPHRIDWLASQKVASANQWAHEWSWLRQSCIACILRVFLLWKWASNRMCGMLPGTWPPPLFGIAWSLSFIGRGQCHFEGLLILLFYQRGAEGNGILGASASAVTCLFNPGRKPALWCFLRPVSPRGRSAKRHLCAKTHPDNRSTPDSRLKPQIINRDGRRNKAVPAEKNWKNASSDTSVCKEHERTYRTIPTHENIPAFYSLWPQGPQDNMEILPSSEISSAMQSEESAFLQSGDMPHTYGPIAMV